MVNLLLHEDDDVLRKPGSVRSLYDPACGTGGMLTVAESSLRSASQRPDQRVAQGAPLVASWDQRERRWAAMGPALPPVLQPLLQRGQTARADPSRSETRAGTAATPGDGLRREGSDYG